MCDIIFQEGVTTTTSYGLAVAKTVRFPEQILNQATELSREFATGESTQNSVNHMILLLILVFYSKARNNVFLFSSSRMHTERSKSYLVLVDK